MKKIKVLGIVLALLLAVIVSATPALARPNGIQFYGSFGRAFISPPSHPHMMIQVFDFNKRSSFGAHDGLLLHVWGPDLGIPIEEYLPCKVVTDNAEKADLANEMFSFSPIWLGAELVEEDDLEVWRKGNKLFANLTVEIPLTDEYYIPPSYIEFEGCGGAIHGTETGVFPSGYEMTTTYMGFDAFVTFVCHPWECVYPAGGFVALHMCITITPP